MYFIFFGLFSRPMQVFKFGGASIRNIEAIRNMAEIIGKYGRKPLVIVVSAMGKTTRHLEAYIEARVQEGEGKKEIKFIEDFHAEIIDGLFPAGHPVAPAVQQLFQEARQVPWDGRSYGRFYDRIVSVGEMVSSTIIAAYLNHKGIATQKMNAPELIKTRGNFQFGKVIWAQTEALISEKVAPVLASSYVVTQGFIASNSDNEVMTLGKEGSDYTAAIFASCLEADSVTIWKDVPGILSADPKLISDTKQIIHLPYTEASEMTYYGANVIHPKTIKPLANKDIPLYVRSFDEPERTPTQIQGVEQGDDLEPTLILKKDQCLFTFRVRDYTFVDEKSLARIFTTLHELDISITILQSSAITISVCFDNKQDNINALLTRLKDQFSMQYMTDLELITLKNYTEAYVQKYRPAGEIILEQRSRRNCRFLVKAGESPTLSA